MTSGIHFLSTVKAPANLVGNRGVSSGTKIHLPTFWDRYDHDTLLYDCVWVASLKKTRLFLPKLLAFRAPLMQSDFFVDGRQVRPKLCQYRRFDVLEWASKVAPQQVHLVVSGQRIEIPVSATAVEHFADRNVIYTMLRNDKLAWVHDWVLSHQRNHGADAVLIANNGSTEYSSQELLDTIASVPGIKAAHVIEIPLPHGPPDPTYSSPIGLKFLQPACLNLVRDRFLTRARAVLICDIDELVTSPDGQSIFDFTAKSLTKYKLFEGGWRFSPPTEETPYHADHVYIDPKVGACKPKYCIVPDSPLGRMCWSVHSLEKINRRIFRPRNKFRFLHCHSINTSWKSTRHGLALSGSATIDDQTQSFMKRTFGG